MVKVSIIIPVYNAENYLTETLDSVANQDFDNYEIIAINDGSSDKSIEILESYTIKIPQLRIFNQNNQGVSITRNKGIDLARGEYICFLDADDIIMPNYLNVLHNTAITHDADITTCDYAMFNNKSNLHTFKTNCISCRLVDFDDMNELGISTSPCTKLYKKDLIKKYNIKFNENSAFGEDYFFNWKATLVANKVIYIKHILYGYRRNMNSSTKRYHASLLQKYENEYKSFRTFASNNGLLTDTLDYKIKTDIVLRLPALLRMSFRTPGCAWKKYTKIKKLITSDTIQNGIKISRRKQFILNAILNNRHFIVFLYACYLEYRFLLISKLKTLADL